MCKLLFVPPGFAAILRQAALNAVDHATDKAGDKAVKKHNRRITMAEGYRIIGPEMSPYSVKVRSYFRYKAIPHQWILRNAASQAEFEKYAKMPIIPPAVAPEGTG